MKKTLIVAVVIIVVVTGLPLLVGMGGMAPCQECGPVIASGGCTAAAILLTIGLFLASLASLLGRQPDDLPGRLVVQRLHRPPRLI